MNEILQTLGNAIRDSGWLAPLVLLVIIMPLLVRIAREVLKARIELADIQRRKEESLAAISAKRPSATRTQRGSKTSLSSGAADAGAVVNTNFDILEKYYEQTLVENRLLSRSAIGVALFGFFVIIAGVSLALSGYTSVGVVSSAAGLLAEASTLLFFN